MATGSYMLKTAKFVSNFRLSIIPIIMLILCNCGSPSSNGKPVYRTIQEQPHQKYIEAFGIIKPGNVKNVYLNFDAEIQTIHVREGQKIKKGDRLITFSRLGCESEIKKLEYELLSAQFELKNILLENFGPKSPKYVLQEKKITNMHYELNELKEMLIRKNIINETLISDIENGVIYEVGYADGDNSSGSASGNKKLLSIYDVESLEIVAEISEEFIKEVRVGNQVEIFPVADRKKVYKGRIERIYNTAQERANETIVVTVISIDDRDDFLLPNFNVDVKILL